MRAAIYHDNGLSWEQQSIMTMVCNAGFLSWKWSLINVNSSAVSNVSVFLVFISSSSLKKKNSISSTIVSHPENKKCGHSQFRRTCRRGRGSPGSPCSCAGTWWRVRSPSSPWAWTGRPDSRGSSPWTAAACPASRRPPPASWSARGCSCAAASRQSPRSWSRPSGGGCHPGTGGSKGGQNVWGGAVRFGFGQATFH